MLQELVGNYRIVSRLGEGGMGVVYLAEHTLLGRKAAVKVLHPQQSIDEQMTARFFNEARATTLIKHPGIVEVFDFGRHSSGSAYIVMEFLEGESLSDRIRRGAPLPVIDVVSFGRQIASALGAAHDKGIVHRDLKPDNLFLLPDSDTVGGARIKVLDFGIAKLTGPLDPEGKKTRTGAVMGTPRYMSPEQCRNTGEVDARTDVYALGCILFEMTCGRPPIIVDGFGDVIAAQLHEEPPRPRSLVPETPPELESVILRALAKRVDDRYPTMHKLKADLDGVLGSQQTPGPLPSREIPIVGQGHTHGPTQRHTQEHTETGSSSAVVGSLATGFTSPQLPRTRPRAMVVLGAVGTALLVAAGVYAVVGNKRASSAENGPVATPSSNKIETRPSVVSPSVPPVALSAPAPIVKPSRQNAAIREKRTADRKPPTTQTVDAPKPMKRTGDGIEEWDGK